jgi:hypothetical protein
LLWKNRAAFEVDLKGSTRLGQSVM